MLRPGPCSVELRPKVKRKASKSREQPRAWKREGEILKVGMRVLSKYADTVYDGVCDLRIALRSCNLRRPRAESLREEEFEGRPSVWVPRNWILMPQRQ